MTGTALAFISDPDLAQATQSLVLSDKATVVYVADFVAATHALRARCWDVLAVTQVTGHSQSYPNGHVNARAGIEILSWMISEVPRDMWPGKVVLVGCDDVYAFQVLYMCHLAGIECERASDMLP